MTLKECSFCENKAEFHIPYENLFGEMEYVLPHCKEHNKKANDAFPLVYGSPFIKVGWEDDLNPAEITEPFNPHPEKGERVRLTPRALITSKEVAKRLKKFL